MRNLQDACYPPSPGSGPTCEANMPSRATPRATSTPPIRFGTEAAPSGARSAARPSAGAVISANSTPSATRTKETGFTVAGVHTSLPKLGIPPKHALGRPTRSTAMCCRRSTGGRASLCGPRTCWSCEGRAPDHSTRRSSIRASTAVAVAERCFRSPVERRKSAGLRGDYLRLPCR